VSFPRQYALFPVPPPAGQLLNPFCAASVRSPGHIVWRTAHLNEVGSGADSYDNNTASRILPSSGQEIASRKRFGSDLWSAGRLRPASQAIRPCLH